jgi:hypothetical protein
MGNVTADDFIGDSLTLSNPTADEVVATLEATTAATNTVATVLQIKRTTSGSMADNFGPALHFLARDDSAVDNVLAEIYASRYGADNTGQLYFRVASAGTLFTRVTVQPALITLQTTTSVYTGSLSLGSAGTYRGAITAQYGSGGNTPGYLVTYSPNGTPWYWFAEDDGTAKIASAVPTQNADGFVIGLQF